MAEVIYSQPHPDGGVQEWCTDSTYRIRRGDTLVYARPFTAAEEAWKPGAMRDWARSVARENAEATVRACLASGDCDPVVAALARLVIGGDLLDNNQQ